MPGGGIHLRSVRALEQELQCELNQPRVVGLRSDRSKPEVVDVLPGYLVIAVVRCARESELNAIEGVKELCPELYAKLVLRSEGRRLEQGDVPVVDSGRTQAGVNAGFCTVSPSGRWGEAADVKPLIHLRCPASGAAGTLRASGHRIWPNV